MNKYTNTIFALSTVMGKSGVAIIRITGPDVPKVSLAMGVEKTLVSHMATYCKIYEEKTGELLDEVILIYFKSPNSFTGEDILEIHSHGSIAVIKDILSSLSKLPFLRMATPGEFSKRAFLNGKMDLTKAEGLTDLIDAETTLQRKIALEQMGGSHQKFYNHWRDELIQILAHLEAFIDYPDEDLPFDLLDKISSQISELADNMLLYLNTAVSGKILHDGFKIVIFGEPNVGKSSLLNYFAKSDVAIVSEIAGTTRDVISVRIDMEGIPVIFYDTAGLRVTGDSIEKEGIKRANEIIANADLRILLLDKLEPNAEFEGMILKDDIIVLNKIDVLHSSLLHALKYIPISIKNDVGLDKLISVVSEMVKQKYSITSNQPLLTRERYKSHITNSLQHLKLFSLDSPLDISTEYVRIACRELELISGVITVDDILDQIFSTFCIGK